MENICEMLPWFVAGTLDPEERRQLILHLAQCTDCRLELPWLYAIRTQLRSEMSQLTKDDSIPDIKEVREVASELLHGLPIRLPRYELRHRTISMSIPFAPVLKTTFAIPSFRSQNIGEWLMAASQN